MMAFDINKFYALMVTAQEAMQAEIVWNVDPKARCEI